MGEQVRKLKDNKTKKGDPESWKVLGKSQRKKSQETDTKMLFINIWDHAKHVWMFHINVSVFNSTSKASRMALTCT